MRNQRLVGIALAVLLIGGMARADFIVTVTTTAGTGMFAGDDVIQWFVRNDGMGLTAGTKKLLALDVTMSSTDPNPKFFIRTFDSTGGSEATPTDADLANLSNTKGSDAGSYIREGSATGFTIVSTNPNYQGPDSGAVPSNPTPYTDGQALPSFQVVGAPGLTTGGINDTSPILFAQSVVPHGQEVSLGGSMGAETGAPVPFEVPPCPEPASLTLLPLGLAWTLPRRLSAR